MFNGKQKTDIPMPMPSYDSNGSSSSSTSLIMSGTTIKGDISSNSDLKIDGTLTGNITSSAKVIVGPSGFIEGDITGQQADISGKVTGTIRVTDLLQLKGNCIVNGNIYAGKLQVEPSANFNGSCHMEQHSSVQELNLVETRHVFE
ncbi:MAG: polymer-forming cytoskeletal protein [Williamsia sp.]|nr:polymer-forming cytoskeletal protein [Williamsia sp.]